MNGNHPTTVYLITEPSPLILNSMSVAGTATVGGVDPLFSQATPTHHPPPLSLSLPLSLPAGGGMPAFKGRGGPSNTVTLEYSDVNNRPCLANQTNHPPRPLVMPEWPKTPQIIKELHAGRHFCGLCGKSLANSWGLVTHIKTVHGEKTFNCDLCTRAFKRPDHLNKHVRTIHTTPKTCSRCGLVCSGKEGLVRHNKSRSCQGLKKAKK
ncbi:hypothetical protein TCAL_03856 [Tigriopus californicus]|uniref:C2H2-type domain-containing protein n=1 Tax=Tigriopus californicus TaxID=6832 RepID=A0A553PH82_TIGCA|nr:zinc finger and BTB domain-containing protein 32-like [Tigriopus californicus]TRY77043.1 hypothetical protein TCAL_03856 [Tigriopus californicus]|eukprot:TCALIF_03856-PA protein Name:"Similar to Prdm13 PR domain zinc finger protein 13 (Mus musculus)" AED:0.09 eAED:0.09 QI:0/-1/0/1/-1/1/1/0/208